MCYVRTGDELKRLQAEVTSREVLCSRQGGPSKMWRPVMLDLFAGSKHLDLAFQALGWRCVAVDLIYGQDLLSPIHVPTAFLGCLGAILIMFILASLVPLFLLLAPHPY